MKIGYARISTKNQRLDLQADALTAAGCDKIVTEIASGASSHRPHLDRLTSDMLREGDTLVVWRLDRLGRNMAHLTGLVDELKERGIHFQSLTENLDTTTVGGQLIFNVFAAVAAFERDRLRERTRAGLDAARQRGRTGGRPRSLSPAQTAAILDFRAPGPDGRPQKTYAELADLFGVSRHTIMRAVDRSRSTTTQKEDA